MLPYFREAFFVSVFLEHNVIKFLYLCFKNKFKKNTKFPSSLFPMFPKISLPASKSECNRALIIQALYHYQNNKNTDKITIQNTSNARDTQILLQILNNFQEKEKNKQETKQEIQNNIWDVQDAGTTMRFLTAFACITAQNCTLTGTSRMQERPIGILVEALQTLGFDIQYLNNQNFPPIKINNTKENFTTDFIQKTNYIALRGDVSSQYISALLLIAPLLPLGLYLELLGDIASKPYIEMTLAQMAHFGIEYEWKTNNIWVKNQSYQANTYTVEGDWSGASYWFAYTALTGKTLFLENLKENSLQGDNVILNLMQTFGIKSTFLQDGLQIERMIHTENTFEDEENQQEDYHFDCKNCPDLAQTLFVVCGALGKNATFTGLESLKIKETDRLKAMQTELAKFGIILTETNQGEAEISFAKNFLLKDFFKPTFSKNPKNKIIPPNKICIDTYEDHRMAMAFAPLQALVVFDIDNPDVVAKSYPHFWTELEKLEGKIRKHLNQK